MAASCPDVVRRACTGLLVLCALAPTGHARAARNSELPINLEAASSDFDYKNNALLFKRVRITQGSMQVEAEEASANGLNFENAEWKLTGSVRITMPDGRLNSGEARVTFRNNELRRAVILGNPARFEQRLKEEQQLAQGHANTIEYDVQAGTVRLTGEAWLSDGRNTISGQTLVYDIGKQRVVGNPTGQDKSGIVITIEPPKPDKTPTAPGEPAP